MSVVPNLGSGHPQGGAAKITGGAQVFIWFEVEVKKKIFAHVKQIMIIH